MAGIRIPFIADVADWLRGTRDVEDSLDDVADSLDDLTRDAERSGEDIEGAFDGAARDADAAAEKMERSFRDAFDTAKREARDAGDTIGKETSDGFKRAEDGAENFKDEADQTARESAASFDGSAESIADAFQEVAANAFAGFGPAGQVAGLAAAAGIGLAIKAMQDQEEAANDAAEQTRDWAEQIRDAGGDITQVDFGDKFREFTGEIIDQKRWWEFWQDAAITGMDAVNLGAELTGTSLQDMFAAFTGSDAQTSQRVLDALNDQIDNNNALVTEDVAALRTLATEIDRNNDGRADALALAEQWATATGENLTLEQQYTEALTGTTDEVYRYNEAAGEFNDARRESVGLAADAFTAEGDYRAALEETTAAIETNGATIDTHTAAGRANREALVSLAEESRTWAQAVADAGGSQEDVNAIITEGRDDFLQAAAAAGVATGDAEALADALGLIPGDVRVNIAADASDATATAREADRELDYTARDREARINGYMTVDDYQAQTAVDRAAANIRPPVVVARLRVGAPQAV